MRSGNPAFSESTLLDLASGQVVSAAGADAGTMTVRTSGVDRGVPRQHGQ